MMVKKWLYLLILLVCQGPLLRLMGTTVIGLDLWTKPVDQEVKAACVTYLDSKGLRGCDIQTAIDAFWNIASYSNIYAFVTPGRAVLYLSPTMIASIKKQLDSQQDLTVYDRFVLLHEVGHLFPYGFEPLGWDAMVGGLGTFGSLGFLYFGVGLSVAHESHSQSSELCKRTLMVAWLASALAMGASVYLYRTVYRPMLQKFKKYTFCHADKAFEKYVKDGYEERDADAFAYARLSTSELTQLHEYVSACSPQPFIVDENDCHASLKETISAIVAELEKRHA